MTLYDLLAQSASSSGESTALADGDRVLSYLELLNVVGAVSRRLEANGLRSGETVAIQIPNSIDFVAVLLALARLKATVLLLDPALKAGEVERYCKLAGARTLLSKASGANHKVQSSELLRDSVPSMEVLREIADKPGRAAAVQRPACRAEQAGFLLLSSGSTGAPKVVSRTDAQTQAAVRIFREALSYCEGDRVLAALPFFHSFGLLNVLLTALAGGATLHVESFSPRATARAIERHRLTVLPATPFMFRLLAETDFGTPPDFSSLRLAVSAGSALSVAVARRFEDKFGIPIRQSYGTTETGPVALAPPEIRMNQPGWVGKPYPGVIVEIWNRSGEPASRGSEGRVAVKSAANASGYLGDPEASKGTFRGDYVLTGDIGCLNRAGDLLVLGREGGMVNVAGKKVSPEEVESCLRTHPRVADVFVFGAKTPQHDERVKALVVPAGQVTAMELREHCASRLADFKVPREIVFVESLSRGPMGKPSSAVSG